MRPTLPILLCAIAALASTPLRAQETQLMSTPQSVAASDADSEIRAIYGTRSPSNGDVIRLRVNPEELIEISP